MYIYIFHKTSDMCKGFEKSVCVCQAKITCVAVRICSSEGLNLAQCLHKSFMSILCTCMPRGFARMKVLLAQVGTQQQLWNSRSVSEPTSLNFLLSRLQVSLSFSLFLPVIFSLSLSFVHFHTTVLTEGSDRLSWPVISVGYG